MLPLIRRRLLADAKRLGRWGERRSQRFLERRGMAAIACNFSCKMGEIDLVMSDTNGAIVFVEVKTRRDESFAQAEDAITSAKRARMARAAKYFLKTYNVRDRQSRFDVVTVVLGQKGPGEIRHYENVFVP